MWRRYALYLPALLPIMGLIWFVMTYGMSGYPYADSTITLAQTAIQASDNQLTMNDLFAPHYRHRIVFSRLFTAMLTHLNQWDVRYEVVLNVVLGIINSILIALLFWKSWGKFAPLMLLTTTLFMLSLDPALNWLSGLQSSWGFVTLFSLLAIHLIMRPSALSFIGAIICAICASLSLGNGILIWGVLVVTLWLNRDRYGWRYMVLVILGGFWAFISTQSLSNIAGNEYVPLQLDHVYEMVRMWLLMHSRPFLADMNYQLIPNTPQTVYFAVAQSTVFSILPALIGFALFGYTAWRVFKRNGRQAVMLYASIGLYASGTLAMIAFITPLQTMTEHIDNTILALNERYLHVSLIFWLVLMSLVATHWRDAQRVYQLCVGVVVIVLIGLHVHTLVREIPYISFNELAFPLDDALQNGRCAEAYVLTADRSCIYASWMTDWDNLDQLASRRLAGYARLAHQTTVPYFLPQDMLILNGESAWQSIHLRDLFFAHIPKLAIIHIAPKPSTMVLSDIIHAPNPPTYFLWDYDDTDALSTWLSDKTAVWYGIRPPLYQAEALPKYRTRLESEFVPAYHLITPDNIHLTRYIRPFETGQVATFGDDLHLVGYQWVGDTDFGACDTIILQTAWMTDAPVQGHIQLSLALTDDPITRAITNTDSAISPISIPFWEIDKAYYDERYLSIPCDLPSGDYRLTLTAYPITDGGDILPNLRVMDSQMRIEGHLLVIGEVVIR
ncbi:MAG: hypothetical protein CUN52_09265 [Phototrophicales bacterium]|nr:MAG: hypothetical protein CUN52_09265 [Phototrophicales bacterium]